MKKLVLLMFITPQLYGAASAVAPIRPTKENILTEVKNSADPVFELAQKLGYHPYFAGKYLFVSFASTLIKVPECDTYKIHLMPQEYALETMYDLLKIFTDTELNKEAAISFYPITGNNHIIYNDQTFACVTIYANGKQQAQDFLNRLYPALKEIPGSGIQPRFSAKVNDLIWVSQGNDDFKSDRNTVLNPYEEPEAVYCRPDYPDIANPKDHYLMHPQTGAPITSGPDKKPRIIQLAEAKMTPAGQLMTLRELLNAQTTYIDRWWIYFKAANSGNTECDTYKIHLMPKHYSLDFIYYVAKELLNNPLLKDAIRSAKFQFAPLGQTIAQSEESVGPSNDVTPLVVLYASGKENAQNALNEIYKQFGNIEGSGIRPRFNGKVNDLIWFAQGNANYKFQPGHPDYIIPPHEVRYEEPDRIYCAPNFPTPDVNHYLQHPATGKTITSGTDTP